MSQKSDEVSPYRRRSVSLRVIAERENPADHLASTFRGTVAETLADYRGRVRFQI